MNTSDPQREVSDCDYDFLADPSPKLANPHRLLIEAGLSLDVRSLTTGANNPILQQAAELHAAYQANLGRQGHFEWQRRSDQLSELLPNCNEFKEVCAESWDWNTLEQAAPEMFNSWKQSPGHWSAIQSTCSFYGAAMALNERQNVWYACMIFANLRSNEGNPANPR